MGLKFVFDEFRCTEGPHADTGIDEQSTICEEFRHRRTARRLPGVQVAPGGSGQHVPSDTSLVEESNSVATLVDSSPRT